MLSKRFGPIQIFQVVGFTILSLTAALPALVAARAFRDLAADYHDGNDTIYIIAGVCLSLVAAIPLAIGIRGLWGAHRVVKATSLAVSVAAVAILVLVAT